VNLIGIPSYPVKRISFIIIAVLCAVSIEAQKKFVIDTIFDGDDSLILYSDKSWEYLDMIDFDGVTSDELHELAIPYGWKEDWNNHVPYTYDNDLTALEDTVWLCATDSNHNKFCMPHPGLVTSTFKMRGRRFHYGIDVDCKTGDTLYSVFDGIVRYAKYNESGFGNLVIIRHYNGLETYYAHLDKLLVAANQKVKAGDFIGLGGKTGRAYGDHLHFEVRLYGNAMNPEELIDFKNQKLKSENLFVHANMFHRKGGSNKGKTSSKSSSSGSSSASSSSYSGKVHVIKSGDTLYGLALKYKTTVAKICEENGISKSKILHTGDKIKIP